MVNPNRGFDFDNNEMWNQLRALQEIVVPLKQEVTNLRGTLQLRESEQEDLRREVRPLKEEISF
ncbi:MAG: hypothetical protein HWD61_06645 [Parachlamydiaceae bacterium]|nr:MAG: hypothetical protein HWD61_06645 [Parachlamydiaceae bacterium]